MIPYSRQVIDQDDIDAVTQVLRSDFLTQGPIVEMFEAALASYTGAMHAILFSSGTAALHAAYFAVGIRQGDEVITSPITFAATPNAALYLGATPVFVDVEKDTGNMDVDQLEKAITERTRAIVPVHYAGHPVDLEAVSRVAQKCGLTIVEDACHALGAQYRVSGASDQGPVDKGRNSGPANPDPRSVWIKVGKCSHSDMTVFSFHPVKQITTGEGGAVLTNRSDLYERLCLFRTHGITKDSLRFQSGMRTPDPGPQNSVGAWYYEMQLLGFNYRLSDIHAALGMSQFRKLDRFIARRRAIAARYGAAFSDNPYFANPPERSYARSSYHLYPIRLSDRSKKRKTEIFSGLRQAGIGVQVHYIPVYLQPYYRDLGYKEGSCPVAEDFYDREISIPLHQGMDDNAVETVIAAVQRSAAE